MRIELEVNNNGIASAFLDRTAFRPEPGEVAALGKTLGYQLATRSSLSAFDAVALFKTAYASMLKSFCETRGIELSEELEEDTAELAIQFANHVEMRPLPPPMEPVPVSNLPMYSQVSEPVRHRDIFRDMDEDPDDGFIR